MISRWKIGLLAWGALCGVSMAQTAQSNDQMVQSFRALLSGSSDTQAVIRAVADAVRLALQEGPMSAAQAQAAMAPAPAPAPAPAVVPPKTWADSITMKGDVRYRTETRQDHKANADHNANVEYDRLRARFGLEAKLNDNVKAVVRLTTDGSGSGGSGVGGDSQSGNQDLNNGASKKPIFLDLAYIDWNLFGEDSKELHFLAGKMANPFLTMPDDLIWDPDTTPEGLAVKGSMDLDPVTLLGNAGYFIVNNRNKATGSKDNQISLYGAQGAARMEFTPEAALTVGSSYYGFWNIQGSTASNFDLMAKSTGTSFYGNSLSANKFLYDYQIVEPFAQMDFYPTVCGKVLPVSVFGQLCENVAITHKNQGYMGGIALGKAKNPQTWEIGCSYARLQKDATLGMWTDSDRWGGGTDGSGYKPYVKYMILKNLMGSVTFFDDRKGVSGSDGTGYERWQFDLTASF